MKKIKDQKELQEGDYYHKAYISRLNITHIFYKHKIDKLLSYIPSGSRFLDAGCGSGVLVWRATKKGCNATGIDISEKEVKFCSNQIPESRFLLQDIRNMNLHEEFDVVNCSDVIEHFYKSERDKIYKNLDKHLRKGGRMIISFPTWLYLNVVEKVWFIVRKIIYPRYKFDDEEVHLYIKPREVIDLFQKNNYRLIKKASSLGLVSHLIFKKEENCNYLSKPCEAE